MIYDLAMAVRAELRSKRFPYPVEYGPELAQREGFSPAIVFYRASRVPGGPPDAIAPPPNAKISPKSPFVRRVAGAVDVFARSARQGATVWEHEEECDHVCDAVLCAMHRILQTKRLPLEVAGSRLLGADDFDPDLAKWTLAHAWPGAAARIMFSVTTLVLDVDYRGNGPPTGTVHEVAPPVVQSPGYPDFNPAPAPPSPPEDP